MGKAAEQFERIWQNILEAFGVKSEKNDETADRLKQDRLIEELTRLEQTYRQENGYVAPDYESIVPTTLGLEKKEYVGRTEESLKSEAEANLQPEYEKTVQSYEEKRQAQQEKAAGLETDAAAKLQRDILSAAEKAAAAEESVKNSAIKRGVIDSSIYENGQQDVAEQRRAREDEIGLKYLEEMRVAREKREDAEEDYRNAVRAYELKYAEKLEKNLQKLQTEERKKQAEADAYNEKIAKLEEEYRTAGRAKEIERQKNQFEADANRRLELEKAAESTVGYTPAKEASLVDRYMVADKYYGEMRPDTAKKLIGENSEFLKEMLGAYFYTLADKYRAK